MKKITKILGREIIIADGSMGSYLQLQLSGDFYPDELNLSRPEIVEHVHYDYACSGADFITSNTFGASPLKLREVGLEKKFKTINESAIKIARRIADMKEILVAGNIGPCGKLIEPLGDMSFDEVVNNSAQQAKVLEKAGADFLLIETITDIQEFRAAVIGSLGAVKIPVLATMAFTNDELTLSGTDGITFAVTSDFVGLSAVGSNCGTSLENMKKVMEKIGPYSSLPIVCQPNAGLPVVEDGTTIFTIKADEFADHMEDIYRLGASIIGSCCGSTPDFTKKLAEKFRNRRVLKRPITQELILSTRTGIQKITPKKLFLVGERINTTGRKKLRKELETGRLTTVRMDAKDQEKHGSDALDININLHKLDMKIARNIIKSVQNMVNIPLAIDSTNPVLIEEFARLYAGKGIINSISGEKKSLKALLPIARRYNLAFIAVLLDDKGISDSAGKRLKVAEKIVKQAKKYGIPLRNIIFDPLVLSAGAEVEKVSVTLETIERLKGKFPNNKTIIGLSNISYGLPNRELVNSVFLAMAAAKGIDMVIANPLHQSIRDQLKALNFIRSGSVENLSLFTQHFSGFKKKRNDGLKTGSINLFDNILEGDSDTAIENIKNILVNESPVGVIEKYIMPAMNEVGRRYQDKEFFLPQLIASADVVKAILPFIKEKLPKKTAGDKETSIVFATVRGDVHDIGKKIVISILESFNYKVLDLGKDVPVSTIITESIRANANVIGLSTLMTTTMPAMFNSIKAIKANKSLRDTKIFIGGAVINNKIAEDNQVYFSRDGMEMVKKIKELFH
jgi:5-methyltetrahydrofolate--homocysteine methyltransferase